MREFLSTYGLWAAFLLALLENDVAFIAIGVVAKLGSHDPMSAELNMAGAVLAAIAGALIHDSFWFAIGHWNSEWFKASRVYRRIGPTIERLANRFGPWEIFFARFIYGTRNPSSVFWGIHRLAYARFAAIDLLGLTVWGSLLGMIGFHFTGWALKIVGHAESRQHPHLLLTAIVVAFLVVFLLRWFNRRRIYQIQLKAAAKAQREAAADLDEDLAGR